MQANHTLLTVAALLVVALANPSAGEEGRSPRDFAGTWVVNRADSQLPQAPGSAVGRPEQRQAPRRGGSPDQGPARGPGGPERSGGRRVSAQGRMGLAETMQLSLKGDEIRLKSQDGQERVLVADGMSRVQERGFRTFSVTTEWKDGNLVLTSVSNEGMVRRETFALAGEGGERLIHTIESERPESDPEIIVVWVYDRK